MDLALNLNLNLLFLVAALSLPFLLLVGRARRRRRGTSPCLPPGSLGLPLLGETLRLVAAYKSEDPEPFVDERLTRYGTVFMTHVFGEATVFSADPETNRFVLQNEGKLFECSYPGSIANLLGRHSLLLTKGAMHKRMHSLTMSFANSSILKDRLLADIDRLIRLNMDSWRDKIFLMEEAKKITFELTMKQLMSVEPGEWTESIRKEYVLVIEGFFTLPIPFFSSTYRRAIRARTKVAEALGAVVRERRKEVEARNDMLGSLLTAAAAGGDDGHGLSDDEVVDFMVALLVAGYETTSTIMTLAVKFLTESPSALSQLKEEHEKIRARKDWNHGLEWTDYKSIPFTQCVINETLRVANIIAGVFRRTTTDVNIKVQEVFIGVYAGYTIPKGWKVFASFRAVHLDPLHFEDARTFDPWRWQRDTVTTTTALANVFMPFGGGPRLCPGYELARVIISVFLHHFVTSFSWVPAEKDKLIFFPTTRMQKRYPIYITRRNHATGDVAEGDKW